MAKRMKRHISKVVNITATFVEFNSGQVFQTDNIPYENYRLETIITDKGPQLIIGKFTRMERTDVPTAHCANLDSIARDLSYAIVYTSSCFNVLVYVKLVFKPVETPSHAGN